MQPMNKPEQATTRVYQLLIKDNLVCNYSFKDARKAVAKLRQYNYPIESMTCYKVECSNKRRHIAYYYEWALEYREVSKTYSKIKL